MSKLIDYISENFKSYKKRLMINVKNNSHGCITIIETFLPRFRLLEETYREDKTLIVGKEEILKKNNYLDFLLLTKLNLIQKNEKDQFNITSEGIKVIGAYKEYMKENGCSVLKHRDNKWRYYINTTKYAEDQRIKYLDRDIVRNQKSF